MRNFTKHNNPWEILAVASWFFLPGLALVLYDGPGLLLNDGKGVWAQRRSFTALHVHVVGWCALAVATILVVSYFYARWKNTDEPISVSAMITVANCFNIAEANILKMTLEAGGIPAFIPDEATAINAPYVFIGTSDGVRVQVAEEHEAEARQILSDAGKVVAEREEKEDEKPSPTGDATKDQDDPEEKI